MAIDKYSKQENYRSGEQITIAGLNISIKSFYLTLAGLILSLIIGSVSIYYAREQTEIARKSMPNPSVSDSKTEARKALSQRGVAWSWDNFYEAIRSRDTDTVNLFSDGGIHLGCESGRIGSCGNNEVPLRFYISSSFDKGSYKTLLKNKTFDSKLCPIPDENVYSLNLVSNTSYGSDLYTIRQSDEAERIEFIRSLCNTKENLDIIRIIVNKLDSEKRINFSVSDSDWKLFKVAVNNWKSAAVMISSDDTFWMHK